MELRSGLHHGCTVAWGGSPQVADPAHSINQSQLLAFAGAVDGQFAANAPTMSGVAAGSNLSYNDEREPGSPYSLMGL